MTPLAEWSPKHDYWIRHDTEALFPVDEPLLTSLPKHGTLRDGKITQRATTTPKARQNLLPTPSAAMADRGPSKEIGGTRPSGQRRQIDLNTVAVRAITPKDS